MKNILLSATVLLALGALVAFSRLAHPTPPLPVHDKDFKSFLKQFPKTKLPYALTKEELQRKLLAALKQQTSADGLYNTQEPFVALKDPNEFISRNTRDLLSRGPVYQQPEVAMETADHVIVVYTAFSGFRQGFKSYMVAVFDKEGHLISKNQLANISTGMLMAGAIDKDLQATVTTYSVQWQNENAQYGTEDKRITGLSTASTRTIDLKAPMIDEPVFLRRLDILSTLPRPDNPQPATKSPRAR